MDAKIIDAVMYAAHMHAGQWRGPADKDGRREPYLNHVLRMMKRLSAYGYDDRHTQIVAALHDVVEDCVADDAQEAEFQKIRLTYGELVVHQLRYLTLPPECRQGPKKAEHQLSAMKHLSDEGRAVKIADKMDNVEGLATNAPEHWKPESIRAYADSSYEVVMAAKMYTRSHKVHALVRGFKDIYEREFGA